MSQFRTLPTREVFYRETEQKISCMQAEVHHVEHIIEEPCLLSYEGEPLGAYDLLPLKLVDRFFETVEKIKYSTQRRASGMYNHSKTFGWDPPTHYKQATARLSRLMVDEPEISADLIAACGVMNKFFKFHLPEQQKWQKNLVSSTVEPEYILPGTDWVNSGIVNDNNRLTYHRDRNNISDTYNCMLVFNRGTAGGETIVPELNIAFKPRHGAILLFKAEKWFHGVAPIIKTASDGRRISLVAYTQRGLQKALPLVEEQKRVRQIRDKIETNWVKK